MGIMLPTRGLALPPAGIAMLVFTGTKDPLLGRVTVHQPDRDIPGIRCTNIVVDGEPDPTQVVMEARGYTDDREAHTAIARAAQACIDAGLRVDFAPARYGIARLVRRH